MKVWMWGPLGWLAASILVSGPAFYVPEIVTPVQ